MIPLCIEGADFIMEGPPDSDVRDLHVRFVDGCFVSRWELTPGELEILNAGGGIELWIAGNVHPPVFLQVVPFVEEEL